MKRICVFCGSQVGRNPQFRSTAEELGRLLVEFDLQLVYGGGSVGLMGIIADSVLAAGGHVIGVIPEALATAELLHDDVSDMRVVQSMHERKALMAELSDAFIALPGGYGTFEEMFEAITWTQLRIQRKLIGLVNTAGYYQSLIGLIDHAVSQGFVKARNREILVAGDRPLEVLQAIMDHPWYENSR